MIIRRVVGDSMQPVLRPGVVVVGFASKNYNIGDVVVAILDGREVIKRITNNNDQIIFLEGDNRQASSDSRTKGPVAKKDVIARIIWPLKLSQ